jgi:hypothetical protein
LWAANASGDSVLTIGGIDRNSARVVAVDESGLVSATTPVQDSEPEADTSIRPGVAVQGRVRFGARVRSTPP